MTTNKLASNKTTPTNTVYKLRCVISYMEVRPIEGHNLEGGFVALPSPPPSSVAGLSSASPSLPRPRHHALIPNSSKENEFIRYVDKGILHVTRRYAKKFTGASAADEVKGYEHFTEVVKDLDRLVDVVWVSGTRRSIYQVHDVSKLRSLYHHLPMSVL